MLVQGTVCRARMWMHGELRLRPVPSAWPTRLESEGEPVHEHAW